MSRKSNPVEARIIREILKTGQQDPASVAVITPNRAQRMLLRRELADLAGMVDTVERLQGGQRPNIII
jgi:superfamily I DNA and/or RNA helicase